MSSGLDCDEGDEKSAEYEDNMWEQKEQPDFYKFVLDLNMVHDPGEKAVYCSGGGYNSNALFIPQRVYVPQYILPAVGIDR